MLSVKKYKTPDFKVDKEIKINFLTEIELAGYSVPQYNVSCSILKKVDAYELLTGISCYKYTESGILDMLAYFNSSSLSSIKSMLSTIRLYIVSANNLLGLSNVSVLNISSLELEPLVNSMAKEFKYITKKEYYNILEMRNVNYQDLMQVILLWHGIRGENYKDLITFEKNWFIGNGLIFNGKEIKLTNEECNIIRHGIEEETYEYYDRFNIDGENREVKLKNSKYLFKPTDHFNSSGIMSANSLKTRLVGFINEKLQMPSLTGKNIYISGVIYRALEENGFNEMSRPALNKVVNKDGNKVGYTTLNSAQDIILNKVRKEME